MNAVYSFQSTAFRIGIMVLLVLCFLLLSLTKPVFAQSDESLQLLPDNITSTSPVYTDLIVHNLLHTFSCIGTGTSPTGQPCLTYKIITDAQGTIKSIPMLSTANLSGGALGISANLIAALFENRPVSTAQYLASLDKDFGMVKDAKAQVAGSGNSVLEPLITLWRASRNISYVIMIIVLMIIGLMVMFRNKINPQTVISAQAALPGIVIGLILITFSYFLAAFVTDMSFVGTNIVGYYFSMARGDNTPQNLIEDLSADNVITIFGKFDVFERSKIVDGLESIWPGLSGWATFGLRTIAAMTVGSIGSQVSSIGNAIPIYGPLVTGVISLISFAAGAITPVTSISFFAYLVVSGMLIYAMFTLLYRLIKVYLTIIFLVITAPFHFLIASLPGRQEIATGWIFNLLGHVLVFPAIIAVFYFAVFITGQSVKNLKASDTNNYYSSVIKPVYAATNPQNRVFNNNSLPLLGGMNLELIQMLLALVALVASPAIPDLIIKAVGKAGQAGQVIGQEFTGAIGKSQGYLKQMQGGLGQNLEQSGKGLFGSHTRWIDETGTARTSMQSQGLFSYGKNYFFPPKSGTGGTGTAGTNVGQRNP